MNFLQRILIALSITLAFQLSEVGALIAEEEFQVENFSFGQAEDNSPIQAQIIQENETIQPGLPFSLVVHLTIADNWHTYWKNPGDSGMPPEIEWNLPEGFSINSVHWEAPERFTLDSAVGFGYENDMFLLVELTAPSTLTENTTAKLGAEIKWLACSDMMCLPGNSEVSIELLVKNEPPKPESQKDFFQFRSALPQKNWELEAQANTESIDLHIKAPENTQFTTAYFCPEETAFVDHKAMTHFTHEASSKHDGYYQLKLNRLDAKKSQNETLKGVLFLIDENKSEVTKVAVDIPVSEKPNMSETNIDSSDEIASLDLAEVNKLNLKSDELPVSEFEGHFAMALFFAFIGGMLLNLMPCVLPVLSLKIFSFVKMSGESRKLCLQHGLAFSVGVLVSFWTLAGLLLILQSYGQSVGWGFQLQEPIFVAALASIIFILGLNLFGVMEVGTSITSAVGNIQHKREGLFSSFFSGILATAIATPCTGPFLGSAVGYAVTLPSILALLIFTMLGAGMAFPYLLLSAYPSMLRFIPRPGNWMITFKEIMGLLMMATTIWLLWVFGAETSSLSMIFLIAALFVFGVGAWIYGKWGTPLHKKLIRRIAFSLSSACFMFGVFIILTATESSIADETTTETTTVASLWEPFSPQRIVELQAKGIPVFVDFTAKWCLICQTNHMSLSTSSAESKFDSAGVVRMKADWTKKDSIITQELRKFGRSSVPLYVLYGKNPLEKPKILPQVLTSDVVVDYLNEL